MRWSEGQQRNGFPQIALRLTEPSLDDHLNLAADSRMRPLFETFRKEVLALDPCVSEEMLKLYVAYKAETNFVDVVPQKSLLRLSLNLHFHELHDRCLRAGR